MSQVQMSGVFVKIGGMNDGANMGIGEVLFQMSSPEISRLKVLQALENSHLSQIAAAEQLGLTTRQVRRLQERFRIGGAAALISRRRGKPSNNRLSKPLKEKALALLADRYQGFGPTLAHEKLLENHGLHLSVESLRQLMIQEELWHPRRARKPVVHQMRMRRAAYGELVQIDGSPHDWFEGRGSRCTLLVFIDDATGAIMYLQFVPSETTWSYFDGMRSYIEQHGKPCTLYSDKYGVFKVNNKDAHQGEAVTQFGRAMQELDIELICAHSPQAKGRVERMNKTLQDRLVKELRLLDISDMESANAMLPKFIEDMNKRFAVPPRNQQDAHRPLHRHQKLEEILTIQETRVLSKNLTLQYNNVIYQIKTKRPTYALRKAHVQIAVKQDQSLCINYKGKPLEYEIHHPQTAQARVRSAKEVELLAKPAKRSPALKANHPWKRTMFKPKAATHHTANL